MTTKQNNNYENTQNKRKKRQKFKHNCEKETLNPDRTYHTRDQSCVCHRQNISTNKRSPPALKIF